MGEIEALNTAKKYANIVRQELDAKAIYLYGSHAKGTAGENSDIDIAIVVDQLNADYLTVVSRLWGLGRAVHSDIEPVLILNGENDGGFLETIQKTGIAV